MITTILEVLVAVVVLIVIIAVAALHFLRADDSDTFDDMPAEPRRTSGPADETKRSERDRPRRGEPMREQRGADDRGARHPRPAYSDRGARPAADERRNSQERRGSQERRSSQERPVPVGARQAKTARPAGPEAAANGWDSLSDVDYWAEVASDKPLATAETQALPKAKPARRGIEPKADAPRPADVPAARTDSRPLPVRQRSQSRARYGAEPATESLAALARLGDQQPGMRPGPASNGQRPGPPGWPAAIGTEAIGIAPRATGSATGLLCSPGSPAPRCDPAARRCRAPRSAREDQPLRRASQATVSDGR